MAVKQLMLRMKIRTQNTALDELRAKDAEFLTRKNDLKTRTDALGAAIEEANTPEEQAAVQAEGDALQAEETTLTTETETHEQSKQTLVAEIADLERQLGELERNAPKPGTPAAPTGEPEQRKDDHNMSIRTRFGGLTVEQRSAYVARTDVKEFLTNVRSMIGQQRAVQGSDLVIPTIMLELLRDNMHRYSKLAAHIRTKQVSGTARQNIAGAIPEAVWTETLATLNELSISFNQIEVDGYMVGGFIPVPNSTLEDSEVNLFEEVMDALGQAIGLAHDKAVVYGTGEKMPLGIVVRLAQAEQPGKWGAHAPKWKDLRATHLLKMKSAGVTGQAFFAELILKLSAAKADYSNGDKVWMMNSTTYAKLLSMALSINSAGAIVSGQNKTMPIVGGDIVTLEFMPDGDIVGGYGSLYLMVERAGAKFGASEHVRYLQNQTLFKGTARYDGMPVLGEAFVAININDVAPTTSIAFAADTANP